MSPNTTYHVRAYATNSTGTAYGNEVTFKTLGVGGTVTDIDGNVYGTVIIGAQTWLAQNLKTLKLNDGVAIPNEPVEMNWSGLTTPAYAWYNNDAATYQSGAYGPLYNFHTVATGKLCPAGWRVPTMNDFDELTLYLGGNTVAGGKLKEAGLANWLTPNLDATNETNFTALPGGLRVYMGPFMGIGQSAQFWSAEVMGQMEALSAVLNNSDGTISIGPGFKTNGLSVRCVQGNPPVTAPIVTTAFPSANYIDATGGGVVISNGGSPVTARGVCWSTNSNPSLTDNFTTDGTGDGTFVSSMTGLNMGTTYYVRAYATNSIGTSYGTEEIFTTMVSK